MQRINDVLSSIDIGMLKDVANVVFQFLLVIFLSIIFRYMANFLLSKFAKTSAAFIAAALQLVFVIGGTYLVCVWAGVNPVIILAILAIAAAGISLSADGFFSSFLSGLLIVLSNRFDLNEYITVGDITGQVKSLGLFNTTIQVNSRGLVTLSNKVVADANLINHSRLPNGIEVPVVLPMSDRHNRDLAVTLIHDIVKDHPFLHPGTKILHEWGTGGEVYAVILKIRDYAKRREVAADISLNITAKFESESLPVGYVTFVKNMP